MQPTATATPAAADPSTAALATSAPVGTNAPVPVAPAAPTTVAAGAPIALTSPTYNYADNVSSGQALQDLTNFQTGETSPVDAYNAAVTSLGIPDVRTNVTALRTNIANTQALLNALPDSVSGRTSGSLVTDAQRSRILGMESAPLTTTLNQQSSDYNTESANLNDLTGQAQNQASLVDEGQKNIESALSTRYQGIQSAEATKAAQDAADRAYQLQVQQIQTQQAQFAAQMAASSKSFAEQQREFNVSQAASAKTAAQPSIQQSASSDAANLLNGIMARPAQYTEKTIIPQLQAAYPELSDAQIKSIVYSNRKAQYGF